MLKLLAQTAPEIKIPEPLQDVINQMITCIWIGAIVIPLIILAGLYIKAKMRDFYKDRFDKQRRRHKD